MFVFDFEIGLVDWLMMFGDCMLFFVDEIGGELVWVVFVVYMGFVVILIGLEGGFDDVECVLVCVYFCVVVIIFGLCIFCVEIVVIVVVVVWMIVIGDW